MSRYCRLALVALAVLGLAGAASAQMKDAPGVKDPALFTRMPNYFLPQPGSAQDIPFDFHVFTVKGPKGLEKVRVEGRKGRWQYQWDVKSTAQRPSPLQIQRNYQNAAAKLGGKVLWEETSGYCRTTLQIDRDGRETWVELYPSSNAGQYVLVIVEKEGMKQDVVADAASLKQGLGATGHVEVPGILFDTNQAVLKPESEAAVAEVAKMLQANPALKVWVVGHTDSVGAAAANVTLSNARAAAVVKALVEKHGVAAARLGAFGAGPYAPVASNADEPGRARNRRVELVAQ